jgi:hypothetical protein
LNTLNNIKINEFYKITKEDVLNNVSQEFLFERYFSCKVELNKPKYKSFLRPDKTGTCYFKYFDEKLRFCDLATSEFLDIFDLIGRKYSLNYNNTLKKIINDFNIKINTEVKLIQSLEEKEISQRKNTVIETEVFKKWEKPHIEYWNKIYNVSSKTIQRENIYAVNIAWVNNKLDYLYKYNDLCFQYKYVDNTSKLYFPNRSKTLARFKTNSNYIDGWDLLPITGDLVVITSSKKDRCVLYEVGIPSICMPSETQTLPKDKMLHLLNHFDYVIVNPDKDSTGLKMAKRYKKEYNLTSIFSPLGKDASGFIKEKGFEDFKIYINKLKTKIII